jgi:hypothetical protein
MDKRKSYNPHGQRLDFTTLKKISDLYSHIFHMTNYVHFYDEKAYIGTKNEPMNNGAEPHNLDENEMIEHLIGDWNADQMYVLTNVECPVILSIGTFVRKLSEGAELVPIIKEISRCLEVHA